MTHYYQRYNIKEDNTFKTLVLQHSNIVIKNEEENDKLIIALSSIVEIKPVKEKENKTDISMIYNSNGINKSLIFSCEERSSLLSKLITLKDRNSKIISDYSIETFKCYLIINMDIQKKLLLKKIGQKLSDDMNKNKNKNKKKESLNNENNDLNKYIAFCTLYRTYWVANQLSSKEIKNYYVAINKIIKIQIVPNIYGLIFDNLNQIEIAIIPINQNDVSTIKQFIISYAEQNLSYDIKYEEKKEYLKEAPIIGLELTSKAKSNALQINNGDKRISMANINNDISKGMKTPGGAKEFTNFNIKKYPSFLMSLEGNKDVKLQDYLITHYNVNRILYIKDKSRIILKCNYERIDLYYVNNELNAQIKLSDIFIIAIEGEEKKYFEIILNNKSRYIFEVGDKNAVLNDIIELLLKYKKFQKIEEKFFIFCYKIDVDKYLRNTDESIRNNSEESKIKDILNPKEDIRVILEDIVINGYFMEENSKQINILLTDNIVNILISKFDKCYNDNLNMTDINDNKNAKILLNLFLVFFKNLGINLLLNENGKKILDNLFQKLIKELENKIINKNTKDNIILNDFALFYNAIHIIEYFSITKQIMFLKLMFISNNKQEKKYSLDYNSMYINMLLLKLENKISKMREIPDEFLAKNMHFYILLLFYKLLINEPITISRNVISLLSIILERATERKQREIKDEILKKTLIFYALIKNYMINNNNDIIMTKNCLKLFPILLFQYYEMSVPIKNIFPSTLIKILGGQKDPDKWDKIECEKFFADIIKDYNEEKIIWNPGCKKDLLDALNTLMEEYDKSVKKKLMERIPSYNEDLSKAKFDELIRIIFNYENYDVYEFDEEIKAIYNIDYINFRVNYKTLKKEVYILDTYINLLVNNKKEIRLKRPKEYWKKLIKELISNPDEKKIIILNAMKLIYEKYFLIIGNFEWYNIINRIYKINKNKNVQKHIKELFETSLKIDNEEIKQNNIRKLQNENISFKI